MLDLFTIFTKGGIVLWYFQGTALSLTPAVNSLIRSVILQERGGANFYNHDNLTLKFKMDNELEIIYVAVYQNILQLSYVDKLVDQVQLAFRDRYKNELAIGAYRKMNFSDDFKKLLHEAENEFRLLSTQPRKMKSFEESRKSERVTITRGGKPSGNAKAGAASDGSASVEEVGEDEEEEEEEGAASEEGDGGEEGDTGSTQTNGASVKGKLVPMKGVVQRGGMRRGGGGRPKGKKSSTVGSKLSPKPPGKRAKEDRRWDGKVSSEEAAALNYSSNAPPTGSQGNADSVTNGEFNPDMSMVGQMRGQLQPLDSNPSPLTSEPPSGSKPTSKSNSGGMFSFFKTLTVGKTISREAMEPALERMKEHLITKNVAVEIAEKLCNSVAAKLDGKVVGTFTGIQSLVRASMEESLVQILSPKRRIDILRDVMEAKDKGQPYVVTFCGVNGVGKSTNLAKACFWLMENGLRVLIAGCDTFRAGAVEQLRTHTKHLNSLHPPQDGARAKVMLYERGYDKDAANIAKEAIHYARQQAFDVVLVDTAGRMQNNEPLMRALAKLIRVNSPDLVLFVGEALVGNEAVDQLLHFNQALVDHSEEGSPRTIDGILLTKFDTVDDKVGAAISMTYITGQPIMFVGTGQTYTDLKSLNVQAVISVLLK